MFGEAARIVDSAIIAQGVLDFRIFEMISARRRSYDATLDNLTCTEPFAPRRGRAPLQCCGFSLGLCGASGLVLHVWENLKLLHYFGDTGDWAEAWATSISVSFSLWAALSLSLLLPRYRSCERLGKDLYPLFG